MSISLDEPFVVFAVSLVAQWLAAYAGDLLRKKIRSVTDAERGDFNIIETATLTLLGLVIGFSFSMAVTRYDQRKNCEEVEANAIGTEYLRVDLLPPEATAHARVLLRKYLEQRISYYLARSENVTDQINTDAAGLQGELWSAVSQSAKDQPTVTAGLVVAGMNDVLNSQGYTQAAWLNRIPAAAWSLMGLIAIASNFLVGCGQRGNRALILAVLPVILSISFLLIADIDSPRGGVIRVLPQNLILLLKSIKG